ncbi:IgGFc-binding protein-like isoform X2 [Haliotis asinina]|uniref:IgGFc-binding protein-like isoform X2 n=1 Tax=Haliotis asinina TaxID=109174 RepID=UPI0035325C08
MDKLLIIVIVVMCNKGCMVKAGTDFVLTFTQVFHTNDSPDYLILTPTTDQGAKVTVIAPEYPDLVSTTIIIAPGETHTLRINGAMAMNYGSYIDRKAIRVTSTRDITVVGMSTETWKGAGTSYDSFLVRPTNLLGSEYYAVCYYTTYNVAGSTFAVVATSNDTVVSITLTTSEDVTVEFDNVSYSGGDVITKTLQQYDVLQIQTRSDLTGSHVIANNPIAAYSGVNRTRVHNGRCASTIVDQLPPVNVWGKEYVTVPFPNRDAGDIYRVLARWANTAVYIQGVDPFLLLKPGDWKEFYLENATYIRATKPVQLAQLSVSGQSDEGDPSLLILSPFAAARTSYVFGVSGTGTWRYYASIVIKESHMDGLIFNNQNASASTVSVEHVEGTQYAIVNIELLKSSNLSTVSHFGNMSFLAYMYSSQNCRAMANSLETAASTLFAPCAPTSGYPGDGVDNDCDGDVDEEACCANIDGIDDDLDLVVDEDCYAPPGVEMGSGSEYDVCCEGTTTYLCKETIRKGHFKRIGDGKYLATNVSASHSLNKQQCFVKCGRDRDCWAVNFQASSGNVNCELLYGSLTSYSLDMNWSHYQQDWSLSVYAPL